MIKKIKKLELNLLLATALALPLVTTISCSQPAETEVDKINKVLKSEAKYFGFFYKNDKEEKKWKAYIWFPQKVGDKEIKLSDAVGNYFNFGYTFPKFSEEILQKINDEGVVNVVDSIRWEVPGPTFPDTTFEGTIKINATISSPNWAQDAPDSNLVNAGQNQNKLYFSPSGWITRHQQWLDVDKDDFATVTIPDQMHYPKRNEIEEQDVIIQAIEQDAFKYNKSYNDAKKIKRLNLSNNIKFIGWSAFADNAIEKINLPDNLEIISEKAFVNNQIKELLFSFSSKLWYISDDAFKNNQLSSLSLPNSVIYIGRGAFEENRLTSINLPNSVQYIGSNAFASNQLSSLVIPDSVERIGSRAFSFNQLSSLVIPDSVKIIAGWAFENNQLNSLVIPDSIEEIYDDAFADNKFDKNSKVVLPAKFNTPEERVRIFGYDYTTKEPVANLKPKLVQKQITNLVKNINNFKKEENY